MGESYEQLLAAARDRTAFVCVDVLAPRDAPTKHFMAFLFELAPGDEHPMRPQGQAVSFAVTPEQARELLVSGAKWTGPAHMRAEVLPGS